MKPEVLQLFSTPVVRFEFEQHSKYVDKFDNWERVDRKPISWSTPLNTSFPNVLPTDPYVDSKITDNLKDDIMFQMKKVMKDLRMPTNLFYDCFWYNAYYEGQGQEPHNHLSVDGHDPLWSGIYFAKNCHPGGLVFCRTEYAHRTQQWFDWEKSKLREHYEEIKPMDFESGEIVLFPPHLHHSVKTDSRNKDHQRLTFSFNIGYKRHEKQ